MRLAKRGAVPRLLAAAALAAPAALSAQAMPVAEFLKRADALERKGPMALVSRDFRVLRAEIGNSAKALRADHASARSAGRAPSVCLPAKADVSPKELLAYFRSIPPPQRSVSVKDAFAGLMRRKYPCQSG